MIYRAVLLAACAISVGIPSAAQSRTLVGRVTDLYSAIPVATGTVRVRGAETQDQIRPDGVFVLHLPRRDVTIVVESPGYHAREFTFLAGQDVALLTLEPLNVRLDPLVVSGHASSQSRGQPTSVARLMSDHLSRLPVENVKQALQGKVPGLEVSQNSGLPGGDLDFRLRGVSTVLGPSTPLYIVDGVIFSDAAIPAGMAGVIGGQEPVPGRMIDLNV